MDAAWIHAGIATVGAIATVAGTLWAGSRNAAKWEGAAEQKFTSISEDLRRLDRTDRDQWTVINAHGEQISEVGRDVARLEGVISKSNGAGAGR